MRATVRGAGIALTAAASFAVPIIAMAPGPVRAAQTTAEEVYLRPASGVFQLEGHGWGHGHGLSQYGAQGAATHGVTYDKILSAYYPNTTRAASAGGSMRVLLEAGDEKNLQIEPSDGLTVTDTATGTKALLPAGPTYDRWRALVSGANLSLQRLNGSTWSDYAISGVSSFKGPLVFSSKTSTRRLVYPDATKRDYRGTLSAVVTGSGVMESVVTLSLEDYLRGVVPRESPAYFHAEALKAQAVAARTYSAFKRAHASSGAPWDICDSTQCQVFGGTRSVSGTTTTELEQASTNSAVDATKGQVMLYQGQPAFTEFSSSNGGWSTDGNQPYLTANPDPWDALAFPAGATDTVHHWTATLRVSDLEARYGPQGLVHFEKMRVTSRDGNGDWGGRVLTVQLDGTNAKGAPVTVDATGGGIYLSHTWPSYSDGLRSNWWRVIPAYDSVVQGIDGNRSLTTDPGPSRSTLTVRVRNTGTTDWPGATVHLIVASPAGSADQLVSGSTKPGAFSRNATDPSQSSVRPGDLAEFSVPLDSAGVTLGSYNENWRVRIGANPPFGAVASTTVTVAKATLTAVVSSPPAPGGPQPSDPNAPPTVDSQGVVIVPRSGSTVVTLRIRNTSNLDWPVNGVVRLVTSGPRGRSSPSAGAGWISDSRPTALGGTVGVSGATVTRPGQIGLFALTIYGNNRAAAVTTESFEPAWEGKHFLDGATTTLTIVRVDPAASRLATLVSISPTTVNLQSYPLGNQTVVVRLRNLGGQVWNVGSDQIGTAAPLNRSSVFETSAWSSASRAPGMTGNATKSAVRLVYPGEVGEWRVPLSAWRVPAGAHTETFKAVDGSAFYGPLFSATVNVRTATFKANLLAINDNASVPRSGSTNVVMDVRNTSSVDWPVGGAVRTVAYASGGSSSKTSGWINSGRPSAVTANISAPGGTVVHPGQTARFVIPIGGNGRSTGFYSETFGIGWEAWADSGLRVTLHYTIR